MYIVSFYESGNSQNIPSVWPSQLQPFQTPQFISGSGYLLRTGDNAFYNNALTPSGINADKAGFGLDLGQVCMTINDYHNYINEHRGTYEAWKVSVLNPEVRIPTIIAIKQEAQRRIVEPLGYNVNQQTEFLAKQINMNGRASEILLSIMQGTVTSGEQAELYAMKEFFGKVKSIRSYSNFLENLVNSGVNIDILSGWPF